jgi:hypothetical protein
VKRCALGALLDAAYELINDKHSAYELAVNALRPVCGSNKLIIVNDHRGHRAVLALFDEVLGKLNAKAAGSRSAFEKRDCPLRAGR